MQQFEQDSNLDDQDNVNEQTSPDSQSSASALLPFSFAKRFGLCLSYPYKESERDADDQDAELDTEQPQILFYSQITARTVIRSGAYVSA